MSEATPGVKPIAYPPTVGPAAKKAREEKEKLRAKQAAALDAGLHDEFPTGGKEQQ